MREIKWKRERERANDDNEWEREKKLNIKWERKRERNWECKLDKKRENVLDR